MKCPRDGTEMDHLARHGVEIEHCPACGGVWLDGGELEHLIEAVRPAIELANPEPTPRWAAPGASADRAAKPGAASRRPGEGGHGPGRSRPYGGRYSHKARLKNILEEIFDFD